MTVVDTKDSYNFWSPYTYTKYSEPSNTGYVVSKLDEARGTMTLRIKRHKWTAYWMMYLGWTLWYQYEPGLHIRRTLPDGGVERWTVPNELLYAEPSPVGAETAPHSDISQGEAKAPPE